MKKFKTIMIVSIMGAILFCGNDKKGETLDMVKVDLSFNPLLVKMSSCSELEDKFKTELKKKLQRDYAREQYYYNNGYSDGTMIMETFDSNTLAAADTGNANDESSNSYSETNVQEAGVDEGDITKTNGNFLYLARQDKFTIVNTVDASNPLIESTTLVESYISEMYLHNNKLILVLPYVYDMTTYESYTKIKIYDVTNAAIPQLLTDYLLPGNIRGTRKINNELVVVYDDYFYLENLTYPYDYYNASNYESALYQSYKANLALVDNLTYSDFIPDITKKDYTSNADSTQQAVECTSFYMPQSGNGHGISFIHKIDLSDNTHTVNSAAVVSEWGYIYMTVDSLYLYSENQWLFISPMVEMDMGTAVSPVSASIDIENPDENLTGIYKFDVSTLGNIEYKAGGSVKGWVNNQFSLGEYQGYLRVGTTLGNLWDGDRSNKLTILTDNAKGELIETGAIENIAPNESIRSMRYDRDRAYMVTALQTDPLFTFDLSDPYNPILAGEIEITGWSTYIHLFGENNSRLLTIGISADASGFVTGSKLQIFNVTNLTTPALEDSYELGSGWSEALTNHHAFLYYDPLKILAIPYESYNLSTGEYSAGINVFNVEPNSLTSIGQITHGTRIERGFIIGDNLYAFSNNLLSVNNPANLLLIKSLPLN
ncbi:MAG: beta-propeller domain-containing protein [Spirochaetia bacterium]|nr:beta-propeller domain-containing protein [Spirochaetia bacterium]